jgi:pilus assembly protein CpaE
MDGVMAAEAIHSEVPECQVIIVSAVADPDVMRRAMVAGAREFIIRPWESGELVRAVRRVYELQMRRRGGQIVGDAASPQPAIPRHGRIIAVFGPKGGIGRTFLAVNLAVALAQNDKKRVLLMDGSLEFGDIGVAMDIRSQKSILDLLVEDEADLDPDLLTKVIARHSSGVHVLLAPSRPEVSDLVQPGHVRRILNVVRRLYDVIILDVAPSLRPTVLTMLDMADTILLLTTPELATLKNLKAFLESAERLSHLPDQVLLVVNRVSMKGAVSLADIERATQLKVAARVVNDYEAVSTSLNEGIPLVQSQPQRPVCKDIALLAHTLISDREGAGGTAKKRNGKGILLGPLFHLFPAKEPQGKGKVSRHDAA